jgi:hypothetical protein
LYGYETRSLQLGEGYRLKVYENSVLRRISEPRRETGENCIMSSIISNLRRIILALSDQEDKVAEACSKHGETRNMYKDFGGKARREETIQKT